MILAGCCVVENILSNFKLPKFWSAWNASLVLRSRPNLLNTFHNLGICLLLKQPLETEKNLSIDEFQITLDSYCCAKAVIHRWRFVANQSSNSALFFLFKNIFLYRFPFLSPFYVSSSSYFPEWSQLGRSLLLGLGWQELQMLTEVFKAWILLLSTWLL